jgi:hypothetical protein
MKFERLIRPEHLSGGDAKQEGVTDVPGGAGHGDLNRSFHCAISHKRFVDQSQSQLHVMSRRHPANLPLRFATGFLDFGRNDTMEISGKFWM